MAAGDVVITGDFTLGQGRATDLRLMYGTVTLDGGNPTPIALANYMSGVDAAVVSMEGSVAPGADPTFVTSAISTTTVNVYAWKITGAADATLIASTNNTRIVNWFAIGQRQA